MSDCHEPRNLTVFVIILASEVTHGSEHLMRAGIRSLAREEWVKDNALNHKPPDVAWLGGLKLSLYSSAPILFLSLPRHLTGEVKGSPAIIMSSFFHIRCQGEPQF